MTLYLPKTRNMVSASNVCIGADIMCNTAIVKCTLTYMNTANTDMEAVFFFPLRDNFIPFHVEVHVNDKVLKVRQQAAIPDAVSVAVGTGHSGYAVKDNIEGVFQCPVGVISKQSKAEVEVQFVTTLEQEYGENIVFNLPDALQPRCTVFNADQIDIEKNQFEFEASILLQQDIIDIDTINTNIHFEHSQESKTAGKINLKKATKQDDVEFSIKCQKKNAPSAMVDLGSLEGIMSKGAMYVNFTPNLQELDQANTEYIFVIDRSGSMHGEGIRTAAKALRCFFKSLPLGSQFNFIGFGSDFRPLFSSGSQPYNDHKATEQAEAYIDTLDGRMGGTNLYKPLEHVFAQTRAEHTSRQIFVLTDGAVEKPEEVIKLVERQPTEQARVFAVGIGHCACQTLVDGLAKAGNGRSSMIRDINDIEIGATVVDFLSNAKHQPIRNIAISVSQHKQPLKEVTILPSQLPEAFHGVGYTVLVLMNQLEDSSGLMLTITGITGTMEYSNSVQPVVIKDESGASPLHTIAASKRIKELDNKVPANEKEKADIEDEKKRLSVAANIPSNVTQTVIAPQETIPNVTRPADEPVQCLVFFEPVPKHLTEPPEKKPNTKKDDIRLNQLLETYKTEGFWEKSDLPLIETAEQQKKLVNEEQIEADDVWATAVAIAILRIYFGDIKKSWWMMVDKAKEWLAKQPLEDGTVDELLEDASTHVKLMKKRAGRKKTKP